jgi:uncharacterized protein YbjT (DUF2867 family)
VIRRPDSDAAVVVAGATGHVGSALVRRLVENGRHVRCIARDPAKLGSTREQVEVFQLDLRDREGLDEALVDQPVAYVLVHALSGGGSLLDEERRLAENFAQAARVGGARRIVYLGGLVDESAGALSDHMASRAEVGRVLRESGVQIFEFRASIVIGAGSFSFELIRLLVEWLPVIALPDWTDNLAQPIALADVVSYLEAAVDADVDGSAVFEIGGGAQISYRRLIEAFADATAARRLTVPVPVPDLAAEAVSRVAGPLTDALPGNAREALKLFESLRHTTVVRDSGADRFGVRPMKVEAAIAAALADEG